MVCIKYRTSIFEALNWYILWTYSAPDLEYSGSSNLRQEASSLLFLSSISSYVGVWIGLSLVGLYRSRSNKIQLSYVQFTIHTACLPLIITCTGIYQAKFAIMIDLKIKIQRTECPCKTKSSAMNYTLIELLCIHIN